MQNTGGTSKNMAALFILLGGSSYGIVGTTYKLIYALGFSWKETMAAQVLFAALLYLIVGVIQFRQRPWKSLSIKDLALMLLLGLISCCTSSFYCYSLTELPIPVALTILFQFTWFGIPVQAILYKKLPSATELLAALIIVVGTIFASGILFVNAHGYSLFSLICALIAAVSFTAFVTISGHVGQNIPSSERGALVCLGSILGSLFIVPSFYTQATFINIAPYGLLVGLFGAFLPVLLMGLGAAKLKPAAITVLASSELPVGLLMSALVLGEGISVLQWLGVACILGGVVLSQYKDLFTKSNAHTYPAHAE